MRIIYRVDDFTRSAEFRASELTVKRNRMESSNYPLIFGSSNIIYDEKFEADRLGLRNYRKIAEQTKTIIRKRGNQGGNGGLGLIKWANKDKREG